MANIFLSIPVMDKPELRMIRSLYTAIQNSNHKVYTCFSENESLIQRARNSHISTFLNDFTDFQYFMSIDSDIEILNCSKENNIFNKLIYSDKQFIGGLYSLKNPNETICSSIPVENKNIEYY